MGRPGKPLDLATVTSILEGWCRGESRRQTAATARCSLASIYQVAFDLLHLATAAYGAGHEATEGVAMKGGLGYDQRVREAVQVLRLQGLSFADIAAELKISKATAGRFGTAGITRRRVLKKPKRCPGCGKNVTLLPCVFCQTVQSPPRPKARPHKRRLPALSAIREPIEDVSIELAGEALERYRRLQETRPR